VHYVRQKNTEGSAQQGHSQNPHMLRRMPERILQAFERLQAQDSEKTGGGRWMDRLNACIMLFIPLLSSCAEEHW
jgi:hypothetical protein